MDISKVHVFMVPMINFDHLAMGSEICLSLAHLRAFTKFFPRPGVSFECVETFFDRGINIEETIKAYIIFFISRQETSERQRSWTGSFLKTNVSDVTVTATRNIYDIWGKGDIWQPRWTIPLFCLLLLKATWRHSLVSPQCTTRENYQNATKQHYQSLFDQTNLKLYVCWIWHPSIKWEEWAGLHYHLLPVGWCLL